MVSWAILALKVQSDNLVQRERLVQMVTRGKSDQVEQRVWQEDLV